MKIWGWKFFLPLTAQENPQGCHFPSLLSFYSSVVRLRLWWGFQGHSPVCLLVCCCCHHFSEQFQPDSVHIPFSYKFANFYIDHSFIYILCGFKKLIPCSFDVHPPVVSISSSMSASSLKCDKLVNDLISHYMHG